MHAFHYVLKVNITLITGQHTHFLYERRFSSYVLALLKKFVQKMSTYNIDEIDTWSFCLRHVCKTVYLIRARKLNRHCVKVTPSQVLASEILNEININCCKK